MSKLAVKVLGRFSASVGRTVLRLHRVQAHLLAYLVLARGVAVSRDRVAAELWPELSDDRVRANLSNAIWRLRRTLLQHTGNENIVGTSEDSVWLVSSAVDSDLARFAAGAVRGDFEIPFAALGDAVVALHHYGGDLLEDWDVEWCQLERESLRRQYLETLHAVAQAFEHRGRPDLALPYAQRAVEADPYSEQFLRQLMRLHLLRGDRVAAVREFRRFARLVQADLGLTPDTQTLWLLEAASGPATAGSEGRTVVTGRPHLVGRIDERHMLAEFVKRGLQGIGSGLLISGEAGIGKSRLAEWVAEAWIAGGGSVAHGRCIEFNEPVPYEALLGALGRHVSGDDFIRELSSNESSRSPVPGTARLLTARGPDRTPFSDRLRAFTWLRTRLEGVADGRPLLVVLEDIQWADPGTADLVCLMLEWVRGQGVALLLTSRPASPRSLGVRLDRIRRHCSQVIDLWPLSRIETRELAITLAGGLEFQRGFHEWLYQETEGNPLFVVETLRLLSQRGWSQAKSDGLPRVPWGLQADRPLIPDGVRIAIQQRLSQLDSQAIYVAGVASVLNNPVKGLPT